MSPARPQHGNADDSVALPATLPLLDGPSGPVVGQATIVRTDDGALAAIVDRIEMGTHLGADPEGRAAPGSPEPGAPRDTDAPSSRIDPVESAADERTRRSHLVTLMIWLPITALVVVVGTAGLYLFVRSTDSSDPAGSYCKAYRSTHPAIVKGLGNRSAGATDLTDIVRVQRPVDDQVKQAMVQRRDAAPSSIVESWDDILAASGTDPATQPLLDQQSTAQAVSQINAYAKSACHLNGDM